MRQDLGARAFFLLLRVRVVDAYPELELIRIVTDTDRHRERKKLSRVPDRMANPKAEPRLHEYTLKNGTKVYGFTVDRVVMPSEWAAVKQEEQGPADLDTAARPFASPPYIRSSTDVLRAARAGCRLRPRARCAFVPSACPLGAGESSGRQEAKT